MIGHNVDADIVGAESVAIPAILLRKRREGVKRFFEDLSEIPAIVEG